ncbi:hypothetical protein PGT21_003122 [Puccinia graminis f. sp. tritici]|uniref:Uncharacterized protein n=1 Tax=Puccinia graminis f. sp. tritici TaxID=56615 RepID=A0A5B0NA50_PUCGR|nr:hypothetical protein PGT21_003122 [Puccinia graminis f. sp. tritici]KAA1128065.1 hypothetical protein PGTUg99_018114 [Puccinia graminis f. sp. tritici]
MKPIGHLEDALDSRSTQQSSEHNIATTTRMSHCAESDSKSLTSQLSPASAPSLSLTE